MCEELRKVHNKREKGELVKFLLQLIFKNIIREI